jgi:hypothetical protein
MRGRYATPASFPLHDVLPRTGGYAYDVGVWDCPPFKDHFLSRAKPYAYDSQLLHRCISRLPPPLCRYITRGWEGLWG